MIDLPTEVWHLILDSASQNDARNVCLACRRLQSLVQPWLFSRIQYRWFDYDSPLPVARLVRTLHRRRDLAHAVTSISLESKSAHGKHKRDTSITTPDDSFEDLAQAAAEQTHLTFSSALAQAVRDGTLDGFVTLLLALTPNVAKLRLTSDFANKTMLLSKLALDAAAAPQRKTVQGQDHKTEQEHRLLGSLVRVEYLPDIIPFGSGGNITNMSNVLPLLYLPSLKNLNAEMENAETFAWPLPAAPDMASLTHLTLSMVREPYLLKILQQAQSLRYLDWEWVHSDESGGLIEGPEMDLDLICEALSCVRHTLTTLKLRGMAFGVVNSPEIERKGSIKRLAADMTNVTTLEASPLFFMGLRPAEYSVPLHECLPASVRRVCFTDDFSLHDNLEWTSEDEMDAIRAWWQVKSRWTPKLEHFELRLLQIDDQWMVEEREALVELGKAHGISVDVYKKEKDYR